METQSATPLDAPHRLKRSTALGYATLEFPFAILVAPVVAVLPPLYAKEYGVTLGSLSLILLILRVLDAATDPIVGILSDRTTGRFGPRKPWIVAGAVLSTWCAWNLFVPPDNPGVFHVGIWLAGLYLGWTLLEVPYRAWSAELASDYDDRGFLSMAVRVSGSLALLLFGFLPLIFSPTDEFDFQVLEATAMVLLVLMPIATLIILMVPAGAAVPTERLDVRAIMQSVRANRALAIWIVTLGIGYLGVGTAGALFFVLFDSHLQLGPHFTLVSTTSQIVALASVPFWGWLLTRYEKRTVMAAGMAGIAMTLPILHFIRPGDAALPLYMLNDALWYSFLMGFEIAILAMVGDLADSEQDRCGDGNAGLISATMAFLRKAMYGLGAAIAYGLTGTAGYDPASKENSAAAVFALQSVNGALPALLCAAAALVAWRYPLNRARHADIRARLDAHETDA